MKKTIRQLLHKESKVILDVDIYDIVRFKGFLIEMSKELKPKEAKEFLEGIETMPHVKKLEFID
jgi:uncharacterized protein (UPF0305 family)